MAPCNALSWSAAAVLLACAAAAAAAPVLQPEEEMVEEIVEEVVEVATEAATTAAPAPAATADPRLTLNLTQIPDDILKHTLISSAVLLDLGVLDTDSDEDIDLNSGTTLKPAPHLTVETLPGSVAALEQAKAEAEAAATTPAAEAEAGAEAGGEGGDAQKPASLNDD